MVGRLPLLVLAVIAGFKGTTEAAILAFVLGCLLILLANWARTKIPILDCSLILLTKQITTRIKEKQR